MLINFNSSNSEIVFCLIDKTNLCSSAWTKELVKNQADYNITNITNKGYTVLQAQNEDQVLRKASDLNFKLAVVFSTGTEFINGENFIQEIKKYLGLEFLIAGHVLDRGNAYYELHHQCYIVNLEFYRYLDFPMIGQQSLGDRHTQTIPIRSKENIHDDYTPFWIVKGNKNDSYNHKCHGWNIISKALENNLPILIFGNSIRENKLHLYPENQNEFLKHSSYLYKRLHFCADEFVHQHNTEQINYQYQNLEQIVTPASGLWWIDMIDKHKPVTVVFYDYNQKSLDYWQDNVPLISNVKYIFQKINLLTDDIDLDSLDATKSTVVNLSNIFAYEGTASFYSLEYRLLRENRTINLIKQFLPKSIINFTARAADGFYTSQRFFLAENAETVSLKDCQKPTWHVEDWL